MYMYMYTRKVAIHWEVAIVSSEIKIKGGGDIYM